MLEIAQLSLNFCVERCSLASDGFEDDRHQKAAIKSHRQICQKFRRKFHSQLCFVFNGGLLLFDL